MKRLLLAAVGLAAVAATSALAADMPPSRSLPPPRAPAYVPFFTWNGFYVGLNAGYGFGSRSGPTPSPRPRPATSTSMARWSAEPSATTCNSASCVFGLEGDLDWTTSKARPRHLPRHLRDLEQLARHGARPARLRLRPLSALPHRRRGLRRHQGHGRRRRQLQRNQGRLDRGAGLEYAFVDNWSAKVEYLYVDLGKANLRRRPVPAAIRST